MGVVTRTNAGIMYYISHSFVFHKPLGFPKTHWVGKISTINVQMVVSNMFHFHPYLGKIPILTSILFKWVATTNYRAIFCDLFGMVK